MTDHDNDEAVSYNVLYREIKQSLTDLDKRFTLMEREREIANVHEILVMARNAC